MSKIFTWIKHNLLVIILVIVILFLGFKNTVSLNSTRYGDYAVSLPGNYQSKGGMTESYAPSYYDSATPQMNVAERKVVTQSNVSLLVKDVRVTIDKISDEVVAKSGYVVNTYITTPEEGSSGSISIRVPADQLKPVLTFLRNNAVKVVSENISGHDVTDQYVDIEARLAVLNTTKATFQAMMSKAVTLDEIMRVQQQIFSIQDQIDSYKGQLAYMDATSSSTLFSISLSTDELSLPYAPDNAWRPTVIFKHAVRSLVGTLRGLGTLGIWLAVYSIVWGPIILAVLFIRRLIRNRRKTI